MRHFPPVQFREGEKYLWNRVTRKPLVNQPEERVRLRFLDYLILEAGWPKSRITTETPVRHTTGDHPLRADLVCYSRDLQPECLIECKAESVTLTGAVAEQIARYNHALRASFLCITNGREDLWFRIEGNSKAVALKSPPFETRGQPETFRMELSYWIERGFAGARAEKGLRDWLTPILPGFWSPELSWPCQFLDIRQTPDGLHLNHYYRLTEPGTGKRLALTFLATSGGETCLAGVLNEEGRSSGLLIVRLDRLFRGEPGSGILIAADGQKVLDLNGHLGLDRNDPDPEWVLLLPRRVEALITGNL